MIPSPWLILITFLAGLAIGWTVQGWRWDADKLGLEQAARVAEAQTREAEDARAEQVAALTYAWEAQQHEIDTYQRQQADERTKYRGTAAAGCRIDDEFRMLHNRAALPTADNGPAARADAPPRTLGGTNRH